MTGVEPGSFELDTRIQLPGSVQAHLSEVERPETPKLRPTPTPPPNSERSPPNSKNAGLSVRELGAVLGISYQRASQLTSRTGLPAERRRAD